MSVCFSKCCSADEYYLEFVFLVALVASELFEQGAAETMTGIVLAVLGIVALVVP